MFRRPSDARQSVAMRPPLRHHEASRPNLSWPRWLGLGANGRRRGWITSDALFFRQTVRAPAELVTGLPIARVDRRAAKPRPKDQGTKHRSLQLTGNCAPSGSPLRPTAPEIDASTLQ